MSSSGSQRVGHAAGRSTKAERVLLLAILVGATALRAFRLDWGLPEYVFNDTRLYFLGPAAEAVAEGDWGLELFFHPPTYVYLLSAITWAWASVTGTVVELDGPDTTEIFGQIVLLQRIVTVLVASATVGAVYLLGKRLVGTRGGLLAALAFGLCPIHILESHRVNVDAPMLLVAVLSAHQAVVAAQERRRSSLFLAFGLAALSGALKYTGLFAGTLPIWVAMRWPDYDWRQRIGLVTRGGIVSAAVFLVAMSPVVSNLGGFEEQLRTLFWAVFLIGSPGDDLTGASWAYAPFVYLTVVGLPFVLGWTLFVSAIAGLVVLGVRNRFALGVLAAATLPFFIVQGSAETATARYYLPLAPYLAIAAGAFLAWLIESSRWLGRAVAAAALAYALVLAVSHVGRVGGQTQAEAGSMILRLADARRSAAGRRRQPPLFAAYPNWAEHKYDALKPYLRDERLRLRFFPSQMRASKEPITAEESLAQNRSWLARVDLIVIPSRWRGLERRGAFTPRQQLFVAQLDGGTLGFRRILQTNTTFWTQSWYDWADPTLDTLNTAGISGYELYASERLIDLAASATLRSRVDGDLQPESIFRPGL